MGSAVFFGCSHNFSERGEKPDGNFLSPQIAQMTAEQYQRKSAIFAGKTFFAIVAALTGLGSIAIGGDLFINGFHLSTMVLLLLLLTGTLVRSLQWKRGT